MRPQGYLALHTAVSSKVIMNWQYRAVLIVLGYLVEKSISAGEAVDLLTVLLQLCCFFRARRELEHLFHHVKRQLVSAVHAHYHSAIKTH